MQIDNTEGEPTIHSNVGWIKVHGCFMLELMRSSWLSMDIVMVIPGASWAIRVCDRVCCVNCASKSGVWAGKG